VVGEQLLIFKWHAVLSEMSFTALYTFK